MTIALLWPIVQWVLKALGLSPESKEKEQDYKIRLLEAMEKKDAAYVDAFARFHAARLGFERVYTVVVGALLFYDIAFGPGRSIQRANELQAAGIPGLLVLSVLLFPFYGPALVSGVSAAFGAAVEASTKRGQGNGVDKGGVMSPKTDPGYRPPAPPAPPASSDSGRPPGPETERERINRTTREGIERGRVND